MKKASIAIAVTALILAVALISLEAYYVTAALVIGILIMGHREIWLILRRRKLPCQPSSRVNSTSWCLRR